MFPPKNNEFYFATIKPQFNLFLFSFLEEIEDIKGTFRNYLTFKYTLFCLMKGVKNRCYLDFNCYEKNHLSQQGDLGELTP